MPVTPTGILSEPLATLRSLVSECPSFQTWVGAVDAATAAERIHLIVAPADGPFPCALIDFGDVARERQAITNAARWKMRAGSDLLLWFKAEASGEEPDATFTFTNAVGAILEEMEARAGDYAKGFPGITVIEMPVPPVRTEEEDRASQGDVFEVCFSCNLSRAA
jgi:hypothetical protein